MSIADRLRFALQALRGASVRTLLMLIAMSIGVASVVVLSSLGEGARRYVVGDPTIHYMDVIAGETMDRLASAERHAKKGEVILDGKSAKVTCTLVSDNSALMERLAISGESEMVTLYHPAPRPPAAQISS